MSESYTHGLRVGIYKHKEETFSNGGISEKCDEVTLVGPGVPALFPVTEKAPAVQLVKRRLGVLDNPGPVIVHAEPVDPPRKGTHGWMAGGSFIASSDSRFGEAVGFYGAVSLHDRSEVQL